jgi:hypothetical protein
MRRLRGTCVLGLLLVVGTAGAVRGEERPAFHSSDEQLLRQARMATETESLLAYLRTLTAKETIEGVGGRVGLRTGCRGVRPARV